MVDAVATCVAEFHDELVHRRLELAFDRFLAASNALARVDPSDASLDVGNELLSDCRRKLVVVLEERVNANVAAVMAKVTKGDLKTADVEMKIVAGTLQTLSSLELVSGVKNPPSILSSFSGLLERQLAVACELELSELKSQVGLKNRFSTRDSSINDDGDENDFRKAFGSVFLQTHQAMEYGRIAHLTQSETTLIASKLHAVCAKYVTTMLLAFRKAQRIDELCAPTSDASIAKVDGVLYVVVDVLSYVRHYLDAVESEYDIEMDDADGARRACVDLGDVYLTLENAWFRKSTKLATDECERSSAALDGGESDCAVLVLVEDAVQVVCRRSWTRATSTGDVQLCWALGNVVSNYLVDDFYMLMRTYVRWNVSHDARAVEDDFDALLASDVRRWFQIGPHTINVLNALDACEIAMNDLKYEFDQQFREFHATSSAASDEYVSPMCVDTVCEAAHKISVLNANSTTEVVESALKRPMLAVLNESFDEDEYVDRVVGSCGEVAGSWTRFLDADENVLRASEGLRDSNWAVFYRAAVDLVCRLVLERACASRFTEVGGIRFSNDVDAFSRTVEAIVPDARFTVLASLRRAAFVLSAADRRDASQSPQFGSSPLDDDTTQQLISRRIDF